jgi:hypothetical protein
LTHVSEVLTASIIRAISTGFRDSFNQEKGFKDSDGRLKYLEESDLFFCGFN